MTEIHTNSLLNFSYLLHIYSRCDTICIVCNKLTKFLAINTLGNSKLKKGSTFIYNIYIRGLESFLPERDYVTFGSLLSQFRLSVCRL